MTLRRFEPFSLLTLVVVLLLVSCRDGGSGTEDDAASADPTEDAADLIDSEVDAGATTPDAADTGPTGEVSPAPGHILVSSTAITGHHGHMLLVFGPGNESEICAMIDGDPWTLEETMLTDRDADSDPCSGTRDDTLFMPGEQTVTVSIFEPGSRTPMSTSADVIEVVDGDARLELDGSTLSGEATGDPGRVLVTVSEITGQEGKILVVLGQNNGASVCAIIDSDAWEMPTPDALAALPGSDAGPCGEDTGEVFFPPGATRITAAVVIPGSQSPDAMTELVVEVDGDVTVAIDGARLSG
ncbi:MAG: hypothetical protein OES24_23510 [Acidimicrobiia bacterium]|nr:hypothetical protein [Acidimicrobiia bacterium]